MALPDQPAPFTPRYSLRLKFAFVVVPLLSVSVVEKLAGGRGSGDAFSYFCAFVVLLMTAFIPFILIRRARFGRELVIDRFLLPPRTIPYARVKDMDLLAVKIEGGLNIALSGVENADEFLDKLAHALAQRNLTGQLEGNLAAQEFRAWQSSTYAVMIAIPLTLFAAFLGPSWAYFAGEFTFLLIYLGLFALIHVGVKLVTQSE